MGIMGVASGGTSALTATGVEPQVPGVWVESAPVYPKMHYKRIIYEDLPGVLRPLGYRLFPVAWWFAKEKAGVNLDHTDVLEALASRKASQTKALPIAVMHGQMDYQILTDQSQVLVDELNKVNTPSAVVGELGNDVYDITEWFPNGPDCDDSPEWQDHVVLALWKPDEYRQKLCDFWKGKVF